jgi:GMP synthase (glutamine-hydrolysing)
LASNKINKIQSINFKSGVSNIWGLQYHPEITYHKMISLIKFRKDKLINSRKCFNDEKEIKEHINFIEKEIKISVKESRMLELKNWLDYLKAA